MIPGSTDTAIVDDGFVSLDALAIVQSFTQDGGAGVSSITGAGGLTVLAAASLQGAISQSGNGVTTLQGLTRFGATGTAATLTLDGGRALSNSGLLILSNGQIALGGSLNAQGVGGSLVNALGGTLEIFASGTVVAAATAADVVSNQGLLTQLGSGTSEIAAAISNSGTISVVAGVLALHNGGYTSGSGVKIAAGAVLDVTGGTLTLQGGALAMQGIFEIDAGVVDLTHGHLAAPGGTLALTGGLLQLGTIGGSVGTLTSAAPATQVSQVTSLRSISVSNLSISGSALISGSGALNLSQTGTLAASADGAATALYLDGGRKLVNRGFLSLGAGTITLGGTPLGAAAGGATLANMTGATMDFADATGVAAGSGVIAFVSTGTIEKLTGTGTATIGVFLRSGGKLNVASGTLALAAGAKSLARQIVVAQGATLQEAGGLFTIAGATLALSGAVAVSGGTLDLTRASGILFGGGLVTSGGTLLLGAQSGTVASLTQSGSSVIVGSQVLTVSGDATLGGTMLQQGNGATDLQGSTTLLADARIYLDGGHKLQVDLAGTLVANGGEIHLGARPTGTAGLDGSLVNAGTILLAADGTFVSAGAGATLVSNSGTMIKTGGTGVTEIAAPIVNTGTIEVSSGTLGVAGASGFGVFAIDDHCVLDLHGVANGGTVAFLGQAGTLMLDGIGNCADVITGFGTGSVVDLAGVTLDVAPVFTSVATAGTLTLTSGGVIGHLFLSGVASGYGFTSVSDGHGGTVIQ